MESYMLDFKERDIEKIVITNTIKMLNMRGLLSESLEDTIKSTLEQEPINKLYRIETRGAKLPLSRRSDSNDETKNGKFHIKIIDQKITSFSKTTNIGDFINTYPNNSISIVLEIQEKTLRELIATFPNTEVFTINRLMINIIEHVSIPQHILLSKEEAISIYADYLVKKTDMPKINFSDPIARYYNAKIEDVFRIIRPSPTSGKSIFYRRVVKDLMLHK